MAIAEAHSLHVRNLSKFYGPVPAVDDVTFSVPRGAFLTLLGPSGSGKTTILMALAGFVEPSAGDILVDDRVITHLTPEKRNFGMVFQGYALFPHLTVAENVAFPLKVRGISKSEIAVRVAQSLDLVQLSAYGDRMPRQLSGGQQQRVALARAMVFSPDMLLLDEPLSALDKKLRADLQWELKSLHARVGMTFIYVTHDQDEALSMSDDIAILRQGKIVQMGAPGTLYDQPRTRFVADFLGKSNFISGLVEGASGGVVQYRAGGLSLQQAGAAPARIGETLLMSLRPEKIELSVGSAAGVNQVPGTILGWSYFGAGVQFKIATPLGEMVVIRPTWRSEVPLIVDGAVTLSWDCDASVPVLED
jgi:putative spermidine/putrescine transport system ATP-binding protein